MVLVSKICICQLSELILYSSFHQVMNVYHWMFLPRASIVRVLAILITSFICVIFFWQAFNNFVAVLSNDRINLHDRNKLNSVLSGLGHCLSLVAKTIENDDISNRQVCTMNSWNCCLFKKFLPDITLLKPILNYTLLLKAAFITYRFMTSLQGNFGNLPLMKITQ
jgi:hypothetical protein